MIAVVGGGISGLAAGHYLSGAGRDVVVLEAAAAAGGVITTVERVGRLLETGPQRTRLTPQLRQLVDELGLTARLRLAADLPHHVYAEGRLRRVPTEARALLTTDLVGWTDRLRALLEPFTGGIRDDESAADFFIRKFGRRTYRRALAPLFGGLYASDPADMRARHALAELLRAVRADGSLLRTVVRGLRSPAAPACTFDGGLGTLTGALADALGGRLRTATPVRGLARAGRGLRVLLEDGALEAEHVVLACPSGAAARILAPLDAAAGARLARLTLNRLATVHLESAAELDASGYQIALDESFATHGVTSQHDLFGRTGLYAAFLGGARRAGVVDLPEEELALRAAAEFEAVTHAPARPLAVHRTAMPAWDTSWDALEGLELPAGVEVCANWYSRAGITGRLMDARRIARKLAPLSSPRRQPAGSALAGTAGSGSAPGRGPLH